MNDDRRSYRELSEEAARLEAIPSSWFWRISPGLLLPLVEPALIAVTDRLGLISLRDVSESRIRLCPKVSLEGTTYFQTNFFRL